MNSSDDHTRVGIFGWGIVAPRSPDVESFERNLECGTSWLQPFDGFGPSNFLVGEPSFDFERYKPWIDERFEPRKFAQLDEKMGANVKYALGAFIQSLDHNPGLEELLAELGPEAHVYVGTGLGDLPVVYEESVRYARANRRWQRFWCQERHHPELAAYRTADPEERERLRDDLGAPPDPVDLDPEDPVHEDAVDRWLTFWTRRSDGLADYLEELRAIESESVGTDIEASKSSVIKRKLVAKKRLDHEYGCPAPPWTAVDARLLWNIVNIPAAQISMLGHVTGPAVAPVAACSTFGTALKLADNAIRLGEAKVAVVGATDPPPHQLSVAAFYNARVLAHDGRVSKPLTGMRGTHIAGGSCVWIVGDVEFLTARGFEPLGLEILGVGLSSDADHIITPSHDGPQLAMRKAFDEADVEPDAVATWDMHATATPGDWTELQSALEVVPRVPTITARKGTFGHGMSVCGGWELTAQHLGVVRGRLHPVDVDPEELHPVIRPYADRLVDSRGAEAPPGAAAKISMGIGGINACVVCRRWEEA